MNFCPISPGPTSNSSCFSFNSTVVGVSLLLMSIVSTVSNTVVLFFFLLNKRLQATFFYMVINLAVADLIVGVCGLPLYALETMLGPWKSARVCEVLYFVDCVPMLVSFLSTVTIAANRFGSLNADQQKRLMTRGQRNCMNLIIVWSLALGVWLANGRNESISIQIHGPTSCLAPPSSNGAFAVVVNVLLHHLPGLILVYTNSIILVFVRVLIVRRSMSERAGNPSDTTLDAPEDSDTVAGSLITRIMPAIVPRTMRLEPHDIPETLWLAPLMAMFQSTPAESDAVPSRERRVVQIIGTILIAHLVLWLPALIVYDVEILRGNAKRSDYEMLRLLPYVCSAANPFLYAFSSEDFQRVYRDTMVVRPRFRTLHQPQLQHQNTPAHHPPPPPPPPHHPHGAVAAGTPVTSKKMSAAQGNLGRKKVGEGQQDGVPESLSGHSVDPRPFFEVPGTANNKKGPWALPARAPT